MEHSLPSVRRDQKRGRLLRDATIGLLVGGLLIIGFLLLAPNPPFHFSEHRGKHIRRVEALRIIWKAIEHYRIQHNGCYPAHLGELIPQYLPPATVSPFLTATGATAEQPRLTSSVSATSTYLVYSRPTNGVNEVLIYDKRKLSLPAERGERVLALMKDGAVVQMPIEKLRTIGEHD